MSATKLKSPRANQHPVRDLWCGRCGYGVVVRRDPPECPMCRQTSWLERARWAQTN